jgi:gluconolactonase
MPIEQVSSGLDRIVALNQEVEWLAEGFGGFTETGGVKGVAEGPVWWKAGGWWNDGGFLLFSDNANNKRYKWDPIAGVSLYREPTNNANGLTRDRQGRLVACEHDTRRVTREELDGSITVVANNYRGLRLNRPNDIVVKSDGAIYFTDPVSMWLKDPEIDIAGVYRVSPDLGQINLLVRDFGFPNGLTFSPDEKTLYVNDTFKRHIRSFRLDPLYDSGFLDMSSERVFCELIGDRPGAPDGMKVDLEGNVYCTGPGGIWIISPKGEHLGTIVIGGNRHATNLCFGGDDWRTLFITTFTELGRVRVNLPGVPVPRGAVA